MNVERVSHNKIQTCLLLTHSAVSSLRGQTAECDNSSVLASGCFTKFRQKLESLPCFVLCKKKTKFDFLKHISPCLKCSKDYIIINDIDDVADLAQAFERYKKEMETQIQTKSKGINYVKMFNEIELLWGASLRAERVKPMMKRSDENIQHLKRYSRFMAELKNNLPDLAKWAKAMAANRKEPKWFISDALFLRGLKQRVEQTDRFFSEYNTIEPELTASDTNATIKSFVNKFNAANNVEYIPISPLKMNNEDLVKYGELAMQSRKQRFTFEEMIVKCRLKWMEIKQ